MTPRLWELSGFLAFIFAAFIYLCLRWPDDESDTALRQEAADVIGLAGGLIACAMWLAGWSLASFGRWLWSRHPGKRVKRGKGRRGLKRSPAVTA